jgi:hypothetical protein
MRRTLLTLPCLVALVLAGCSKPGTNRETGAVGGTTDTSTMQPSTIPSDTAPAGGGAIDTSRRDTSTGGAGASDTSKSKTGTSDSAKSNQSKSGVTNTKTGESTLGPGAKKTRPDQGQPVTSKGDTISGDSSSNPAR